MCLIDVLKPINNISERKHIELSSFQNWTKVQIPCIPPSSPYFTVVIEQDHPLGTSDNPYTNDQGVDIHYKQLLEQIETYERDNNFSTCCASSTLATSRLQGHSKCARGRCVRVHCSIAELRIQAYFIISEGGYPRDHYILASLPGFRGNPWRNLGT